MSGDDDIRLDLPFWANGTLSSARRAEVEAALAADPELAAEARALAAIREGVRGEAEAMRSPGEFGLARLMRDAGAEGRSGGGDLDAPRAPLWSRPAVWQLAAAVAVVALIGQGIWLRAGPDAPGAPGGFEMASGEVAGIGAGGFRVAFAPGATEADLRALLTDAGLEIVGGPGALGLYVLALPPGADDAARARARAVLTGAEELVEDVEDVDG